MGTRPSRHSLHHKMSIDEEAYALIRKEGNSLHRLQYLGAKQNLKLRLVMKISLFCCYCYRVHNSRYFSPGLEVRTASNSSV